jgi:hypothetical protein
VRAASTSFHSGAIANTTRRLSVVIIGSRPRAARISAPVFRFRTTSSPSPSCGTSAYASQAPSADTFVP